MNIESRCPDIDYSNTILVFLGIESAVLTNSRSYARHFTEKSPLLIDLNGNAYDMSMTHGRTLAKEIKANLELYFIMVRGLTGIEPQHCLTYAGRFLDVMQTDAPFLLEEMEGIARGAGMSLKEILSFFINDGAKRYINPGPDRSPVWYAHKLGL